MDAARLVGLRSAGVFVSAPQVAIVGGGMAGLAAAWELEPWSRAGALTVHLYEASDRFGGPLQTDLSSGLLIEGGPDSFLTTKPEGIALCSELGLSDALIGTSPSARGAYIYRKNRLHRIPPVFGSPTGVAARSLASSKLLSGPGRLRAAAGLALTRLVPIPIGDDVALGPNLRSRFGSEAVDWLFEPFVAGLHPAPLDVLSTAAIDRMLPVRWTAATHPVPSHASGGGPTPAPGAGGRASRSETPFVALRDGMAQLPRTLLASFRGTQVHPGQGVSELAPENGRYSLRFPDGSNAVADTILLAISAGSAAHILRAGFPDAARELARIRLADLVVVGFVFHRSDVPVPLDGTGVLVPRRSGLPISAVTWLSSKWERPDPTGESVALRVFVRVEGFPSIEAPDAEWSSRAREGLRVTMGIQAAPAYTMVFRHPRCLAWYSVGHAQRVGRVRQILRKWPRIELIGSSYDGVGIPDAIRSGRQAARRIATTLGRTPPSRPAQVPEGNPG
ncbi:MAG: FAD-dependent oxidoreductase [Thermoplasmata archaeon]